MRKTPPDILITTPESLYLMLSSGVREILARAEAVIVDEIHAVAQIEAGVAPGADAGAARRLVGRVGEDSAEQHGEARRPPDARVQRIGLSATQRPLERIAQFLVGPKRECEIVDAGRDEGARPGDRRPGRGHGRTRGADSRPRTPPRRALAHVARLARSPEAPELVQDVSTTLRQRLVVRCKELDLRDRRCRWRTWPIPGRPPIPPRTGRPRPKSSRAPTSARSGPRSTPSCCELVQEHTSTIIFVNTRRAAERLAKRLNELANGEGEQELPATEHAGHASRRRGHAELRRAAGEPPTSRSPAPTTAPSPTRSGLVVEEMLKSGQLPCLVATSSLELGIDMGAVDLVIQVESPKSVTRGLQRIGRAGHSLGEVSKGRIFPKFRADLLECAVVARRMRDGRDRGDGDPAEPARRARPAPGLDGGARRVGGRRGRARWSPPPSPSTTSPASSSRTSSTCSTAATPPTASPSCARGSSGTAPRARCTAAKAPASWSSPTPARSPTAASTASTCPTAAGSASSTRRWSTRPARARPSCSARRPGGSRRSPATG